MLALKLFMSSWMLSPKKDLKVVQCRKAANHSIEMAS